MKKKLITAALVAVTLAAGITAASIFRPVCTTEHDVCLYLDKDDDLDSVKTKLSALGTSTTGFSLLTTLRPFTAHSGRYVMHQGMSAWDVFVKLRLGAQDAVNMTVPSVRTLDRLAGSMARGLLLDSLTLLRALEDEDFIRSYGYDRATLPALIIPNTYQVYWDITLEGMMERMVKENKRFWNEERTAKAQALGLSTTEVVTLASIVDEETACNAEKPTIAGLYLNRLRKGMLLQADPTVKKAVGDWSLRRVLNEHLRCESPYNTYLHQGLPPGPLRIVSVAGIDAVLNAARHDYLYMCAKEDFSGTHNFATTLAEHQRNAQRYVHALNQRGIR